MAITLPTSDDFLEKFPEFEDNAFDDDAVTVLIAEAAREVDDEWAASDQQAAILYLAAHLLMSSRSVSEFVTDGGPPIKSESIGRISTTYGDPPKAGDRTTTNYGQRFEEIRDRNVGGAWTV